MNSPPAAAAAKTLPFDEAWLSVWAGAFIGEGRWQGPSTIQQATSPDGSVRALIGLSRQRFGPLKVAAVGGYYWPQRGVGFVGRGEFKSAAEHLASSLDANTRPALIRMGPVAADDAGTQRFIAELTRLGWRQLRHPSGPVMRLALPDAPCELSRFASQSMLKNLVYLRRRLTKQHGEVRSTRFSLCDPDAASLIERLAAIEAKSWVTEDGGIPKFAGVRNKAFWSAFMHRKNLSWEPVVWVLQVGDSDVAFSAHIEAAGTLWIIANSYDAAWKPHSPGSMLTMDVLVHAMENGVRLVDWGQGDSGYKSRWGATEDTILEEHLLFPPNILGLALHTLAKRFSKTWRA